MAIVTAAHQKAIADLYIALFNRAPDADGFGFWTQALANGVSLDAIARNFVTTPEARAVYPDTQTGEQFVSAYYSNVLGRPIDASGLAFWTTLLQDAGGVDSVAARAAVVSQIVEIVNTPLPVKPADISDEAYALTFADRNAFKNKGEVAIYYAVEYKGNDLALAKQVLAVVGPTAGTIDVAKELLNPPVSTPEPPPPTTAQNYTGTSGVDIFAGSPENDTFSFVIDKATQANTTLNPGDRISGNDGVDTLKITARGEVETGDFTVAPISGIETVAIRVSGPSSVAHYDVAAGVTTLITDKSDGVLVARELTKDTTFVFNGGNGGYAYLSYQPDVTTASLTLTGGIRSGTLSLADGLTTTTITSTGAANTLASLVARSATVNLIADAALSVGGLATGLASTVNITGAGAVSLGLLSTGATIDAHLNTGGLTAELSTSNLNVTVLGSQGNDVISTGSGRLTGAIDAGDGNADRLIATATVALDSSAVRARYTGFEILEVRDRVTVDVDGLPGITSVEIADLTGTTGVTNLTAAQAAAVKILSANSMGAVTIGLQNTGGTNDTVKAVLSTNIASGAQAIDLAGLRLTGIEKLELTGNTNVLLPTGLVTLTTANAVSLDSIIVKNVGGATVTVDGGHTATNLKIDASDSLGIVTLDASAYNTATGVTLKAGANTSTLTGSAKADILHAGKTVSTSTTMTGGAGGDIFVFSIADNDTAHGRVTAVINDFQTGIDKISFTVATPVNSGSYTVAGTQAESLEVLLTTADAALNGTVKIYVGQVGADSYVVADANGTGYTEVIRLAGVALDQVAYSDFVLPPP